MPARVKRWVEDRTAPVQEDTPAAKPRGAWLNTFGAAILVMLGIEAITGVFLAMYYSPGPDSAYESVHNIVFNVPMGRVIHGIHHFTSYALVVLIGLHLLRTLFQGAYKPPRELVWITGIILLQLVLGFAFTGDILPWDQKAYWDTIVRTKYAGSIPFVGEHVQAMLRGGENVGAMTLTRFYAGHILILPALVVALTGVHVWIASRKGGTVPGAPVGEEVGVQRRRAEGQLLKDTIVSFLVFAVVYYLAWTMPTELEFKANANDPNYLPRPQWYLLFLFQFMKVFHNIANETMKLGLPEWVPAVAIPGAAITFLTLLPWIDRGRERRAARRAVVLGLVVLGALGAGALHAMALRDPTLKPNASLVDSPYGRVTNGGLKTIDPTLIANGKKLFEEQCAGCHVAYKDFTTGPMGPEVTESGHRYTAEAFDLFIKSYKGRPGYDPKKDPPSPSKMPEYPQLTQQDLTALGAYLSQAKSPTSPLAR